MFIWKQEKTLTTGCPIILTEVSTVKAQATNFCNRRLQCLCPRIAFSLAAAPPTCQFSPSHRAGSGAADDSGLSHQGSPWPWPQVLAQRCTPWPQVKNFGPNHWEVGWSTGQKDRTKSVFRAWTLSPQNLRWKLGWKMGGTGSWWRCSELCSLLFLKAARPPG